MNYCNIDSAKIRPFLRWTGSKRWFIKEHISTYLPKSFNNYHEPFLGGGSTFFHIKGQLSNPKRHFFLSDSNEELINCYTQIRDNVEGIILTLKKYTNSEDAYYKIRDSTPRTDQNRAAKFIYLNRTSFNGIYRVNSDGKYNVPYGKRPNVDIVTKDLLREISKALADVTIETQSFKQNLTRIKKNDLVFIDPPYTVAHENNGFIEYNQRLFSWDDQIKLKEFVTEIKKKKAYYILTNASHSSLYELYRDVGEIHRLSRTSQVGGRNKTRGLYNELVVFNTVNS